MDNISQEIGTRAFVRHPTEIPIEISSSRLETPISPNLKNVSQGGMLFRSEQPFSDGDIIEVTISFVTPVFRSKGIVVWSRGMGDFFEVGVRFHNSDDYFRMRMVEQICYIEAYRRTQLEECGRNLTSEEAALEWIERFAASFPRHEE